MEVLQENAPCDQALLVGTGRNHSCALLVSGRVKCWGRNDKGQLGLGDTENRGDDPGELGAALPHVALGTNARVVSLSVGLDHNCAVLQDGSVRCWGYGAANQLESGEFEARGDEPGEMGDAIPRVPLEGPAKSVVASGNSSCAFLQNGSVWCWGEGRQGQLGSPVFDAQPKKIELPDPIVDISIQRHTCALTSRGEVYCWGENRSGKLGLEREDDVLSFDPAPPPVRLTTPTQKVRAGNICSLAIDEEGALRWWGEVNMRIGQEAVGDSPGEMGPSLRPLDFGGPKVRDIAVLQDNPCALLETGAVKCWGFANSGIPGPDRGTIHGSRLRDHPAILLRGPATAVDVGATHACALLEDRSVQCWGENRHGALGRPGPTPDEEVLPVVELGASEGS